MRTKALTVLGLLLVVFAGDSKAAACFCGTPSIEKAFERSAAIFLGQVVQVTGPRELTIGTNVEQLHVVKFFVWERWKGPEGFEVEILSAQKQRSCFSSPPMEVGETYLVFAEPVNIKEGSSGVQGIVTPCNRTTRLVGPAPEHAVYVPALATIFELDELVRPVAPQRSPAFGRQLIRKSLFSPPSFF